ncbi:HNH endonuclease signature motif containing protein [Pseudarthrobacter sp. efr-133-R2A-89]|uniref:HNH endonuclease signature motif containing protein n=1 Tax=Pseudarthrobacter sp. efr-133-R2A-89 TaxID=3040302 RepID=UPI0025529967|nr:HNH endonuclease signature motif containing protein [Pseudarthrobacter sp. efr-133-R2A-89]
MGIGSDLAVVMEGVSASVAALCGLVLEDASLCSDADVGADVDVLQRRYGLRLERLELVARLEAQLAAVKAQDVADTVDIQHALLPPDAPVDERTYAEMSVVEEIAGILTISSAAAGALVEQSRRVCSLPPVFEALAAGGVSWQHARIVADETEGLTPAGAAGLVAHFFDPDAPNPARGAAPGDLVPSRFRAKVRAWRERYHPETLEKRHAKGVADRRMDYAPDRDGMAWLSFYLPGDTACAIWNRSTATARGLQNPDEPRTLTQLRADVAASLLLGAGNTTIADEAARGTGAIGKIPTPRADVLVTVPVFSLLGLTEEPAVLDGFGPIPASMARGLVAGGAESFYRVLVDPRDGAPLEIGRTRYRLPETLKKWIRLRDGKCTFPGCTNHTPDNDTDHLTPWHHGGTTDARNLAQLCPRHHRLKHARPWTPDPATRNEPPGWTSPTGRHYTPEQHDPQPTHWPPGTLPAGTMPVQFQGEPAGIEHIPPWEPDDANLIDLNDLPEGDPVRDEFFARPFVLSVQVLSAVPQRNVRPDRLDRCRH